MEEETNVLIVEDNLTDAYIIENLLSDIADSYFKVQHVTALNAVQNAYELQRPDVILLDLSLPDAQGLDTIRELKKVATNSPIVVMTGSHDKETIDRAVQAGAQDLLHKGEYSAKFLGKTIRYAIERKKTELELKYLAHFDQLTGVANRALFLENMNRALSHARRHKECLTLMFIDLDNFKNINDSLGHNVGDDLLVKVADRLLDSVRESDTVARLGGDEFAVILEDSSTVYGVETVAKRILQKLSLPFEIDGQKIYISASIGVAISPESGDDVDTLLKNADIAMYGVKNGSKNNYQIFTESFDKKMLSRIEMERYLQDSLARDEFELYYQPLVDVKTGEVHAAEALLRWRHPETKKLVPPIEFISILEESGLITSVGEWVLKTACKQCKRWHEQGMEGFCVAVNVSPRQLQQSQPVKWIAQALWETGLDGSYLNIEITEDVLLDNPTQAEENIRRIREMGVAVSIDDFGTGYSSLSYLMNYEFDILKIDRSFLSTLSTNKSTPVILKAIIQMAHGLGLKVVAEGVEQEEQYDFLEEQGCDVIQGYLFSQPIEAKEVYKFVSKKHLNGTLG